MEISIGTYLLLAALAVVEPFVRTRSGRTKLYVSGAVLLILLAALRDFSMGTDTGQYLGEYGFLEIMALPWHKLPLYKWELGYTLLNKIAGSIYFNQRFVLVAITLVILVPLMLRLFRDSLWGTLSLVCLYGMQLWISSILLMRQGCAVAILTFSYRYCKQRKFFPFLVCVMAAMLFHRTAGIWLLLYFVYPLAIDRRTIAVCGVVSIFLGLMGQPILWLLNCFVRYKESAGYHGGLPMYVVLWMCVLCVFLLYKGKIPPKRQLYFWMLLVAATIQPIAFTFSNFSRIVWYFRLALVVLLPNVLWDVVADKGKPWKTAAVGALLCGGIFMWYVSNGVMAYTFGV